MSYRSSYSYPWKSSYVPSSSSYSSSSSSYGSSRFSTEPSSSSRFGSLSSTAGGSSTYRPSFTSGTYRSPRSTASNVSTYINRYSSIAAEKEKEKEREKAKEEERRREREREREQREKEREKERDREKERLIETSKKLEAELEKDKPKLIKRSALIAAKYGAASNDGEDASKAKTTIMKPKKDNAPPVTFTTRYGKGGVTREKSREPSPATRANSSTNLTPNRARARDPSPAGGAVANKIRSRDPSPAVENRRAGYTATIANKLTSKETPTTTEYRRQPSNTLNSFLQNRARSRDPSPTVRTRTSREPSPTEPKRTLKPFTSARSRDPSPATPRTTTAKTINRSRDSSPVEPKKFSSSITIKTGIRSRDPSPAESKKIPLFTSSKLRSRDPSPAGNKLSSYSSTTPRTRTRDPSPAGKQTPTYGRTLTGKDKPAESRSLTLPTRKTRDPSPSVSKIRSRDPSPAQSTTRRSSREPSPAESIREKYGLNSTTYRPYGRTSSNSIGTSSSRISMNSSPVPTSPIAGMALSYMTSNEAIAARTSRPSSRLLLNSQSREVSQCPSPLLIRSQIFSPEPPVQIVETDDKKDDEEEDESESSTETETSEEGSSEETESSVEPEPKIFMEITLVTRATSPTPPGSTPYLRARRAEMCKTLQKTIQKQILNVETADKAIQSDRMDDPTKYLRYNQPTSRNWSPFLDTKFSTSTSSVYTRYSSASSRYSRDSPSQSREPSVCSTRSDVPEKKEEKISTLAARVKEMSLSKSASPRNNAANSRSSTSTPSIKQKTPPKQKSPEKPPPAPMKDGSPAKSMTAFNSRINKDFRKSALNMGPAPDRPRKGSSSSSKSSSSTSSSSTTTQTTEPAQQNGSRIPQAANRASASPCRRSDRSSSTSSDASSTATSSSSTESDAGQTRSTAAASTDEPNANNELLMRAIQLATNFVQNNNRNHTSWFENGSATSVTESQTQQEVKTGWEAGTHYMESIKDDDSSEEEEEEEEGSGSGSGPLQKATWWNNDDGFVKHPPVQATTMQEEPVKSYRFRIRPIQSGEKAWWMTEESEKTEEGSEMTDEVAEANGNDSSMPYSPFKPIQKAESSEKPWWMTDTGGKTDDQEGQQEEEEEEEEEEEVEATSNEYSNGESQNHTPFRPIKVTRVESGEKAWWMMSTDNVPGKAKTQESSPSKSASREASKEVSPEKKGPGFTVYTLEAEDEAWWQQAMAELEKKDKSSSSGSSSRTPSKEPTPEPRQQGFIVTRAESGEKAWWMYSEEKANEEASSDSSVKECSPVKAKPFRIMHVESGEAPWWMTETDVNLSRSGSKSNVVSRSNSFNNSKQQSPTKYRITRVESGEKTAWMDSPEEKSVSPQKLSSFIEKHGEEEDHHETEMDLDEEIQSIGKFVAGLPQFPTGESTIEVIVETPLGDRASPEGVEDSKENRSSPYDNIPQTSNNGNSSVLEPRPYQLDLNPKPAEPLPALFISRHTKIDDLLGGSCHPLSPMMDRMFVMDDLMEISEHDVRVHDSTAQFIGSGEGGSLRKAGE